MCVCVCVSIDLVCLPVDLSAAVVDLQIGHGSKIDWLELNETGHKLLYRDKSAALTLLDTRSGHKEILLTGCSFVQVRVFTMRFLNHSAIFIRVFFLGEIKFNTFPKTILCLCVYYYTFVISKRE